MYDERYIEYIELFNERYFYDCHEVLEDLWLDNDDESRRFYQGLIHLAAAYLLLFRGKHRGAHTRFRSTLDHLAAYPASYKGLDLEAIRANVLQWIKRFEQRSTTYDDSHVPLLSLAPEISDIETPLRP